MTGEFIIKPIGRIRSDFSSKFGIPRQSGLAGGLISEIIFEKEYAVADAVRGLEGFSHLWIIWQFSENLRNSWSPTVRPPRLGGNVRMGVFATRSPFRPNPIGLSCVELKEIVQCENNIILRVAGADLMDGTPIYDIKPYIPYTDAHPEAECSFASTPPDTLKVKIDDADLEKIPEKKRGGLICALEQDPRPAYQSDQDRVYGFGFAGFEVRFRVRDGCVHVINIEKEDRENKKEKQ